MRQSAAKLGSSKTSNKTPWISTSVVFHGLLLLGVLTILGNFIFFFLPVSKQEPTSPIRSGVLSQNEPPSRIGNAGIVADEVKNNDLVEKKVVNEAYVLDEHDLQSNNKLSLAEGQERIVEIFRDAGIELDSAALSSLPSWNDIVTNIGGEPKIYGLDRCEAFRASIPPVERMVGCCGMFNSGTNLVTRLLKENCKIPERVAHYGWNGTFERWGIGPFEAHGMRWQVPWGKHTAAKYRKQHTTNKAGEISKESVLPVVTIRHPYDWMKSMCKNHYTAKWPRGRVCPKLVLDRQSMQPTNLSVKYGAYEDWFDSLAHLWNGWYHQYWKEADYPFLMVRFEDLVFHAKNVTTQVCHCVGGVIRTDRPFYHIVKSAKDGPGHGRQEERTDMVKAWIRYGNPLPVRGNFTKTDYKAAKAFLDKELMNTFRYKHPRPA